MRAADTDFSGTVDYTEFIAATLDRQFTENERNMQAAFDIFDVDGSGKIDNKEVMELLSGDQLTHMASKEAIAAAMKEIDENGDGEIDFEEFKIMMKKCNTA